MEILNIKDRFGNQLEEIFREDGKFGSLTFGDTDIPILKRKYAYIEQVEKNALLFIGLNPSRGENQQTEHFYYKLEQTGGNGYPAFWKPFEEIGKAVNLTWTHLDLLGVRETKQALVKNMLCTQLGVDFVYQQLLIAKQIIEAANPKMIVVSNSLSRHFFGYEMTEDKRHNVWMGFEFKFNEEYGTETIITEGPLCGTPVFFTSMLSGQRALDNGSEKRLIWHIKRVYNMLEQNKA